jgi:hypothetical protein
MLWLVYVQDVSIIYLYIMSKKKNTWQNFVYLGLKTKQKNLAGKQMIFSSYGTCMMLQPLFVICRHVCD